MINIRPWRTEDAFQLSLIANNKNISFFLTDSFPSPYTEEDAKKWISYCISLTPISQMTIVYDNILVGSIGINIQHDIYRKTGEIGFWLSEDFWNKGIMTTALKQFTKYCFDELHLNRLYARVFENNFGSQKVLKKGGYKKIGILQKEILKAGKTYDAILYDIIKN